jgi:hypothetical protein
MVKQVSERNIQMWVQGSDFIKNMGVPNVKITFPCFDGETYEETYERFSKIITIDLIWIMWDTSVISGFCNTKILTDALDAAFVSGYEIDLVTDDDNSWLDSLVEDLR